MLILTITAARFPAVGRRRCNNASGSLRGSAHGDTLSINVASGSAFSAHMSIVTAGGRQSVDIRPKGIGVTDVSVTMTKAR